MLEVIFNLIVVIVTILLIREIYIKSETIYEKVLCIILVIIIYIPMVIYYFDRYNIASKLGYTQNVNVNRWFEFLTNYIGTVVGTIISSLVVIFLTVKQIQIQINESKENKRIENMPIFKYDLSSETDNNVPFVLTILENGGNDYNLFLTIENIGLNHSKNVKYELFVDDKKVEYIGDKVCKMQSFIKKNEKIKLCFLFKFNYGEDESQNSKKIKIIISYEDLLGNAYKQQIFSDMILTSKSGKKYYGFKANYININVEKEELIK